ncbi:hypothetical protein PFISCL1PPCAC_11109, partial [Pristionchus fissidentatus]
SCQSALAMGEPSAKTPKADRDEIPINMQFFKWSRMHKLSPEAISIIQSQCYGENQEVNEFFFKLMTYYHKQTAQDKAYQEKKKKQAKTEVEQKPAMDAAAAAAASLSSTSAAAPADNPPVQATVIHNEPSTSAAGAQEERKEENHEAGNEDDVQFLMEKRAAIIEAMAETESEVEETVEQTVNERKEESPNISREKEPEVKRAVPTPNIVKVSTPAVVSQPNIAAVQQPVAAVAESVAKSPAPADAPQSPRIRVKQEVPEDPIAPIIGIPTVKSEWLPLPTAKKSLRPPESPDSTVAVANAPFTVRKTEQVQLAKKTMQQVQVLQQPVQPAVPQPRGVSFSEVDEVRTYIRGSKIPKESILPAPAILLVKSEPIAAGSVQEVEPQQENVKAAEMEAVRRLLTSTLPALNQQIIYINQVKQLASSMDLISQNFNTFVQSVLDPGSDISITYFRNWTKYIITESKKTEKELNRFGIPSVTPLIDTLRSVKNEVFNISKTVREQVSDDRWPPPAPHLAPRPAAAPAATTTPAAPASRRHLQREKAGNSVYTWQSNQPIKPGQNKAAALKRMAASTSGQEPVESQPSPSKAKRQKKASFSAAEGSVSTTTAESSTKEVSPAPSSTASSSLSCAYCWAAHDCVKCPVYETPSQREKRRKELRLCWCCLKNYNYGHANRCPTYKMPCPHCHLHQSHVSLCRRLHLPPLPPGAPRVKHNRRESHVDQEEEDDGAEFSPPASPYVYPVTQPGTPAKQ